MPADDGPESGHESSNDAARPSALLLSLASDRLAAAEEEAATIRATAFADAAQMRKAAAEQAAVRLSDAEAAVDELMAAAHAAAADAAAEVSALIVEARSQLDQIEQQVGALNRESSTLANRLRQAQHEMEAIDGQLRVTAPVPASQAKSPVSLAGTSSRDTRPAGNEEEQADAGTSSGASNAAHLRVQRRLALTSDQASFAARTLTAVASEKLDGAEELLVNRGLGDDQRHLTVLVHLRDAEDLCQLAALLGHAASDLTDRILLLRRRLALEFRGGPPR